MLASSVHFNGSVNLPDAEAAMREISSRIPRGVRRMTDGETGERGYWILFQIQKFGRMPEFERVAAGPAYEPSPDAPEMVQFRLADGASADTIDWPNLGYADAYADSFEVFDRLQQEGTIPADVRFQVQYPTPLASMAGTIVPEDMPAVAAAYESGRMASGRSWADGIEAPDPADTGRLNVPFCRRARRSRGIGYGGCLPSLRRVTVLAISPAATTSTSPPRWAGGPRRAGCGGR